MRPPVVVGGGPAGATAALSLREAGQPVTLIERSATPPAKACGDFLGAAAVRIATACNVPLAALGARVVTRVRFIRRQSAAEVRLPFRGMSLSRRAFDASLLRRCSAMGVDVMLGQAVRPVRQEGDDFLVEADGRPPIVTGTVFLATGRPEHRQPGQAPRLQAFSAYKTYFQLPRRERQELAGLVEVITFPGGHAALQCVEEERVSFCLLSRRFDPDTIWPEILEGVMRASPHLARRLANASDLLGEPIVARDLPFGYLHRARGTDHDGLYRIGDQAAFLTSLIADGVSVAMRSGSRAAQSLLSGAGSSDYQRRLRGMLWPRVRLLAEYDPTDSATVRKAAGETPTEYTEDDGADEALTARWSRLIA